MQAIEIAQYQIDQREHVLFAARVVARGWGHPGYNWYGITDDGASLCRACVCDNYRIIVTSTVRTARDGWGIVGFSNTGDSTDLEVCAHCSAVLFDPADDDATT